MISFSPIAHVSFFSSLFKPLCLYTHFLKSKDEIKIQENFLDAVLESYVDGKPLHLMNRSKSAFRPLTEAEFDRTPVRDLMEIFSSQNIVVHDIPQKRQVNFDEDGFYRLIPSLDEKIDIQGMSSSLLLFFFAEWP